MASRDKENKATKPDFSNFLPNKDELKPEMPNLEEYFKAESEGVHPFDRITNSFEDSEINTFEEQEAEIEREKGLYKRQLLGKLMGTRLSAAEYEIVNGFYEDAQLKQKRVLDVNNQEFLENRQQIRLMQEEVEKIRRQKVMSGEWPESQSHQLLQNWLDEEEEKWIVGKDPNQIVRDYRGYMAQMKANMSTDLLHEKEYHFDEGVGVSLDQHVEDLKDQYPRATVQTRRDRDGFAIVKLSFKPEYKYDLDHILSMDEAQMERHNAETYEAILAATSEGTQNLTKAKLQHVVNSLTGTDTIQ